MQIKQVLHQHCVIQIHNGNSSIWSTPWCALWDSIHDHINLSVTVQKLPHKISDLWLPHAHTWNKDLISKVFDEQATGCITATPMVPSDAEDKLRWMPAKRGVCTPSIPNCKSFQESWRVKASQV